MPRYDPQGRARDARFRLARHVHGDAQGQRDAERRACTFPWRTSGRRRWRRTVQGHGRALRRLRLRPRGRPRRSRPDRALHDGRRRVRARLHARELQGLFVAGEDAGGVHGANRLGGNGVANSTVFGGVAGDTMAAGWRRRARCAIPTRRRSTQRSRAASRRPPVQHGSLEPLRERLYELMWDKVGIIRDAAGLRVRAGRNWPPGRRTRRTPASRTPTAPST